MSRSTHGSLIIDIAGKVLQAEEREMLAHPLVAGVILFSRNYESYEQLKALCAAIRAARPNPLLITVDQEGGRVQRFIADFTRIPPMQVFGKYYDSQPELALKSAEDCAWLMASELLTVGVDLSFAPVLDLGKNLGSVIGNRAFHADPEIASKLALAFMRGMQKAGMATTGKHFPGHGSVSLDSHVEMPRDERTLADIMQGDLIPFMRAIDAHITAIMAAHIIFPAIDKMPVSFSAVWLKNILRERLQFKGIVLSDDLNMQGANISAHYPDRVKAAYEAGCDVTLLCNNRAGVIQTLQELVYKKYLLNDEKWCVLQGKFPVAKEPLQKNPLWLNVQESLLRITENLI